MPALPTTNLTGHWDASTNADVFSTNNPGGAPSGSVASGGDANVWRSKVNTAHLMRYPSTGTAPQWKNDSEMLLPSMHYDPGEASATSGHQCTDSNGSGFAPSTFFTSTAFTLIIAFKRSQIWRPVNQGGRIFGTFWNCITIYTARDNPGAYTLVGQSNDNAGLDTITISEPAFDETTSHVACLRRDGTTLYFSIDGGAESSVAAGATVDMGASPIYFGRNQFLGGGQDQFSGRIGEAALYNANLTGSTLADAIQYFTDRWLGTGNSPPVADAGPDNTVVVNQQIALAGSGSDPDVDPLTYLWEVVSGPGTATFVDDEDPVTLVSFDTIGTYVLKLTVSDGANTDDDTMTMTVVIPPLLVDAGPNQTIQLPINSVSLCGSHSYGTTP